MIICSQISLAEAAIVVALHLTVVLEIFRITFSIFFTFCSHSSLHSAQLYYYFLSSYFLSSYFKFSVKTANGIFALMYKLLIDTYESHQL